MWSIDEGGVMIKEHEKLLCNNMRATSSPKIDRKICLVHPYLSLPVIISCSLLYYHSE